MNGLQLKIDRQQIMTQQTFYSSLYYVGVPIFVGLFSGWGQSPAPELSVHFNTALYFTGFILIGWLCCVLAMSIGKKVLAPWRPPLWVLSVLPPLVLGWLALIPMNAYLQLTAGLVPQDANLLNPLPIEWTSVFFTDYVLSMVSVLTLFCGVNYLFQMLGLRKFDYDGDTSQIGSPIVLEPAEKPSVDGLPFINLLPNAVRAEPLSIRAQEHYIHVRTANGSALVKYPFGNAVKSLNDFPGIQVHRSYWVNDKAVVGITKVGQRHFIQTDAGEEIPISQTYSRSVREHFAAHFSAARGGDG